MFDDNYKTARFNMVEQQVRPWDVIDQRVLKIMQELPREQFVSDEYKGLAYADIAVPMDNGEHMLKPTLVGRLLQALAIKPTDSILEIGTGTGYITACLAKLGAKVNSVEIDENLLSQAGDNLAKLGISNVMLTSGDAMTFTPQGAPFDVIAVTGALADCQDILPKMLKTGGRLFFISGEPPVMQAMLIERVSDDAFHQEIIFETEIETLQNIQQKPAFTF